MSATTTTPTQTTAPTAVDHDQPGEPLLTPAEVAALFRVDPKTVTRWAKTGRITCIRTLGGHRRYPAAQFHTRLHPTATTGAGVDRPVG